MNLKKLLRAFLATVLCFTSLAVSQADEFDPADFTLNDHAALVPVLEGVRRVRVCYLDKENQWQVYAMAHLAGDEGQIKLRLPDEISLAEVRIDASFTDPFPYEVYAGRSDFVTEVDGINAGLTSIETAGNRTGADAAGNAGVPAEVQESDLWKWRGDTLYFYNQLRGLQVFDFTDPAKPERSHSIRMPALGEDMFLHPDGEHLVLLAKRWSWGSSSIGSEAVVIRHNENGLSITNRIPLPGNNVVESRMVGSHLYVAMQNSRRVESMGEDLQPLVHWETGLTVEHTDLSDPTNPVTSEPLNLFSADGWWSNATVSATSDYFIVAPYVYDREDRTYKSTIKLIDIRDQNAPLKIAASVKLDGHLKDKFKLRIRDNILTCVTQGGRWNSGLKTVVANYDLGARTGEGEIPRLDHLVLAPQETLFATRFDGDRVYVVTAIRIDPLFVVDLSDDDDLRLMGELKIPGWSHYLQPRGDRLLSVGVEDRRVAISQFDVSDPENLKPPLRVYLGEEGSYSWSEGNYDEQAIGYFPDRGVMILPYQSYGPDGNNESALQILTFDDDSLEKAGVIKTDFAARRATLIDEDTLVSVSGREVKALDVSELSGPQPLSSLEAAWTVDRVIPHGDHVLQIETGGAEWNRWYLSASAQKISLRVTADDALDTVLARLELGGGSIVGLEVFGDFLHILTKRTEQYDLTEDQLAWRQVVSLQVVDLRNPTEPSAGEPMPLTNQILHNHYHGRELEDGSIAWIPEIGRDQYQGRWIVSLDYWGWGGRPWLNVQANCAQILLVDASDPTMPTLVFDYRVGVDTDGPVENDEGLKSSLNATVSGVLRHENQVYLSFQQNKLVTDPNGGRDYYETQRTLRVVTLADNGAISVTAAVNVPGKIEGVREVGDDSGLLLLSSAPATTPGIDQRLSWSNDLILQTSAFDGVTTFLINEVTIPNGSYNGMQVTDHHFAVPYSNWHDGKAAQGINFYPFDLTGEIGEAKLMELEFHPGELGFDDGILSATGWAQDHQVWWMLNSDTINNEKPAVVQTPNRFYANFDQTFYDKNRSLAWVPVGAYGIETVDIDSLFKEPAASKNSRKGRSKGTNQTWVKYQLTRRDLTPADGVDVLGPLAAGEIWHFKVIGSVTYSEWMARQMGQEDNPNFVEPLESEDLDGDGISNWGEFALGTNPTHPDSGRLRIQRTVAGDQMEIEFDLPRGHQGVIWEAQTSKNFTDWETLTTKEMSAVFIDAETTRMVVRFSPGDHGEAAIFRLNFKR
ncbi:MAG: hypothetical protein ACI9NQ_000534 [Paracoccaceae bacterium]|jgi:hypothetical protein